MGHSNHETEQDRPAFVCYIGIDYSGAETSTSNLKGLRVYLTEGDASSLEVPPPQSSRTPPLENTGAGKASRSGWSNG